MQGSVQDQPVGVGPVRAVPLVQPVDDRRQRLRLRFGDPAGPAGKRHHLAGVAVQRDRPGELLLVPQVGQLDQAADVHRGSYVAPDEGLQCLAVEVVPVERGIGEAHDLRQKGVHPDEAAQCLAEPVLLVFSEGAEALDRRA